MLPAAMAQKWEFGAGVGAGFYTPQNVTLGSDSASAKFKTNVAVSTWVGENMGDRWGGELRYSYQLGDARLKQNSTEAMFGAESHTIRLQFPAVYQTLRIHHAPVFRRRRRHQVLSRAREPKRWSSRSANTRCSPRPAI